MDARKGAYARGGLIVFGAGILWGTMGVFVKELERLGAPRRSRLMPLEQLENRWYDRVFHGMTFDEGQPRSI